MGELLNISIIQTDIFWQDKQKNLNKFNNLFEKLQKTDLVLLPEMFNTGFSLNPEGLAETWDGKTVSWLISKAKEKKFAIGTSIIFVENNQFFNRFLFVYPDGAIKFYDKRHLFTMSGEHKNFTVGKKIVSVEYLNWKIRLLVCYDLRFPVWSRNTDNYDLMIYVANWPTSRIQQWKNLLIARAIENQSYVVGVNRIGKDGNGFEYSGNSLAINYKGEILFEAQSNEEVVKTISLDLEKLKKSREKFPVLKDADDFEIKL